MKKVNNKFFNSLTKKAEQFGKLKTIKGIDRRFEALQDENYHSYCSLLLAVHYGTKEDVEMVKNLIIKQSERPAPNRAYNKRIKMTSKFYKEHKKELNNE
jgi:hypothetical protein